MHMDFSPHDQKGIDSFRRYLRRNGLSYTSQRRKVFEEALKGAVHFEVEELVAQIRRTKSRVSRATVYRTIGQMEAGGFIRKIDFDHAHAHYEFIAGPDQLHHEHFICEQCGKVIEFTDERLETRIRDIAAGYRVLMKRHAVQIFGICRECTE